MTHGVVTPNIVAPTSGFASSAGTVRPTMPAIAPAAFAMIRADTRLTPAMSTTEYIIVTSTAPTYGRVSPDATVETISFGTPTGSARIARVAIDEPPEPPSARMPSSFPSACSCAHDLLGARGHRGHRGAAIACGRELRDVGAAARATSSRAMSGSMPTGSWMPASTSSTSTPCSRSRSRRNAYSTPFVSSVPSRTTRRHYARSVERLDAEEAALQLRILRQLRRGRLGGDRARHHHELALGERRRHAEVLLDQQDREPFLLELLERLDQVLDDRRREPLGRLVHDQERRVREQRARDREHLLLAAGELRAAVSLALAEAREELVRALDRPALRAAARAEHAEMLVDRERREEAPSLRHVADAELRDLVRRLARRAPRRW